MKNISVKVTGDKLTIEVDLSQTLGPSASGKTTLVASSEGNATIPGHPTMRFGLNVFAYPERS